MADLTHLKRRQREVIMCLIKHPGSYVLTVDDYRDMSRESSVYDDQGNEYLSVPAYIVESFAKRGILTDIKSISKCTDITHTYLYLDRTITAKMI